MQIKCDNSEGNWTPTKPGTNPIHKRKWLTVYGLIFWRTELYVILHEHNGPTPRMISIPEGAEMQGNLPPSMKLTQNGSDAILSSDLFTDPTFWSTLIDNFYSDEATKWGEFKAHVDAYEVDQEHLDALAQRFPPRLKPPFALLDNSFLLHMSDSITTIAKFAGYFGDSYSLPSITIVDSTGRQVLMVVIEGEIQPSVPKEQ
ncbi:hypothetical protein BH11ARM1_BH11ARM1_07590 [soil metagenome]